MPLGKEASLIGLCRLIASYVDPPRKLDGYTGAHSDASGLIQHYI
jgi:hypothetical protein